MGAIAAGWRWWRRHRRKPIQNVAAGNYSAGASVANSAYRSASVVSSPDMQRQAINIEVTGTLEARGDALVAVIDNNRKKRLATT